jgi:predicted porin
VSLPYDFAVSGEFGRQFLGTSKTYIGSVRYPDYNTWNAGITYTYKQASLDLRYSGTDLNKTECGLITSDPKGLTSGSNRSKWCGNTFLATLAVDFVYSELKK